LIKHQIQRPAFSLVELIFVIVVLGIVASLGSELIANVYKNYILQRAQHRAEFKTELAALQIANRLQYAIPGTIYRRTGIGAGATVEDIMTLPSINVDTYHVLQWVSSAHDSFEAIGCARATAACRKPGWSGFIDLNQSTRTLLNSDGSNFSVADRIIRNLRRNGNVNNAVVYFPYDTTGYVIQSHTNENLTLAAPGPIRTWEHYKLAWSSYALSVESGNLYLYYNLPPVIKYVIPTNITTRALLLRNVTVFKFRSDGQTIRFKLCTSQRLSEQLDDNITVCKEKAIFF